MPALNIKPTLAFEMRPRWLFVSSSAVNNGTSVSSPLTRYGNQVDRSFG